MKSIIAYALTLVLFWGLVSCDSSATNVPPLTVDPIFRELYDVKGGETVLGPPISPAYGENGRTQQFTSKVLLAYDPFAPDSMHFQFRNLGIEMGFTESPPPDGFEVYPGFLALYRALGGTQFTGRPLTGVMFDPENKRIVQYFENVGIYQHESDPPGVAHLLDYGAWKCASHCGYKSPPESAPFSPGNLPPVGQDDNFKAALARLNPTLAGTPLTNTYINANDGKQEIIYANIVVYEDSTGANGLSLRPLPMLLGIPPDPPHQASNTTDGVFVATGNGLGYDVPSHFDDYINLNNGYDFIGLPISDYKRINDNLYRQCFENLCLDYHSDEEPGSQIRPMALGRRYKRQQRESGDAANSFAGVTLTVWTSNPLIDSTQAQTIYALVLDGGIPLYNIDLALTVSLPDGSQQTAIFPPTDANGRTSVTISPIAGENADSVIYEVCVDNITDETTPACVVDDFLIWGNP